MLYDTFNKIAIETWDKLKFTKYSNLRIGEESFTDFNLLELMRRHPKQIKIKTFNKNEESENGADWEFWVQDSNKFWVGFRIQAKVINLSNNKYEHLHYKKKGKAYQCNNLIDKSLGLDGSRYQVFPMYCLYTCWDSPHSDFEKLITKKGHEKEFGCSIVDAFTILGLQKSKRNKIEDLLEYMFPWNYLLLQKDFKVKDIVAHWFQQYTKITEEQIYHTGQLLLQNKSEIFESPAHSNQNQKINERAIVFEEELKHLRYWSSLSSIKPREVPPRHVSSILRNEFSNETLEVDNDLKHVVIFTDNPEDILSNDEMIEVEPDDDFNLF